MKKARFLSAGALVASLAAHAPAQVVLTPSYNVPLHDGIASSLGSLSVSGQRATVYTYKSNFANKFHLATYDTTTGRLIRANKDSSLFRDGVTGARSLNNLTTVAMVQQDYDGDNPTVGNRLIQVQNDGTVVQYAATPRADFSFWDVQNTGGVTYFAGGGVSYNSTSFDSEDYPNVWFRSTTGVEWNFRPFEGDRFSAGNVDAQGNLWTALSGRPVQADDTSNYLMRFNRAGLLRQKYELPYVVDFILSVPTARVAPTLEDVLIFGGGFVRRADTVNGLGPAIPFAGAVRNATRLPNGQYFIQAIVGVDNRRFLVNPDFTIADEYPPVAVTWDQNGRIAEQVNSTDFTFSMALPSGPTNFSLTGVGQLGYYTFDRYNNLVATTVSASRPRLVGVSNLKSITPDSITAVNGQTVTFRVDLQFGAGPGGMQLQLENSPGITLPSSVTVAPGAMFAEVQGTVSPHVGVVRVRATGGGAVVQTSITVG
jgi:hypothetical protein